MLLAYLDQVLEFNKHTNLTGMLVTQSLLCMAVCVQIHLRDS